MQRVTIQQHWPFKKYCDTKYFRGPQIFFNGIDTALLQATHLYYVGSAAVSCDSSDDMHVTFTRTSYAFYMHVNVYGYCCIVVFNCGDKIQQF